MAAHAGVPDQVEIHLSAGGLGASTMSIRKRSITLDSDNPALPIGRASKVFAKGFVAAEDNGWFDSPVMSRTHAEIVANLAEQRVQLRDLGSLHGTYLNGKEGKLPAQELCDLKDGDELAFGLPILRGPDEYLPITVKVGIAFKTSRSYDTSTFQVPDGSDCSDCSSDESDYSSDSSDASGASGASARSITHLDGSNPLCKPACASEVIDLTEGPEDADDEHQAQEIIDLSSPPSSPPPSSPIPDLIDQEASSDIDELQEEDEDLEIELDGIDSTDAGPSFDAQTRGILDAVEQLAEPLIFDDHFSFMNLIRDGQDEYDGSDVSEGESYVEYPDDASSGSEASSDEEVDYESDGSGESESGLGEAMEEDEPSGEDEDSDESVTSDRDSIKGTHWDASAPELMNCPVPELVDRPVLCGLSVPYLTPASTTTANPPFRIQELLNEGAADTGRCPASSDVQERIHSGNLHSTQPYVANNTAVEQLGIKTGKAEFFAAREDNKATLSAYKSSAAQSTTAHRRHTSSIYTLCNDQETPEYQFQSAAPANATASKASDSSQKLPSVYSMVEDISDKRPLQLPSEPVNGYHMESFGRVHPPVPSKTTDPEPVKIFAPEPFKASTPEPFKASTPEPFKVSTPEPAKTVGVSVGLVAQDPRRTGVAISDIVESHQSSTPKRKADDISGVTTQEEKWAAIMSDESQSAVVPEPARESSPADTIVSSLEAQPATADLITQAVAVQYNGNLVKASPTGERPVKRMRLRHLAESVGMAALGGVMVMGALIYSAPTFA